MADDLRLLLAEDLDPPVLAGFNNARYASFSKLLRCTFDEALPYLADSTIDLPHIDGLHTYEAGRHDFESWLPKLSDRAVVLFHDTNVRARGIGIWRLFLELKERYPTFEFLHSHGLGLVAAGRIVPAAVAVLCALDDGSINSIRERFARIGDYHVQAQRIRVLNAKNESLRAELVGLRNSFGFRLTRFSTRIMRKHALKLRRVPD